jgi:2-methylcitrate dehydratase PrpD
LTQNLKSSTFVDVTSAERLAQFASGLRFEDLPAPVADAALLHLIDAIGCAIAAVGCGEAQWATDLLAAQGGAAEATAVGCPAPLPAPSAALVNGVAAHALDFDDTHGPSVCHVSAVVGPAALAVAQATGASGRDLLAAFVAGAECTCRVGMASPGGFHARGFHSTSVCGVLGATVAAGRLFGLAPNRLASALGIAGSFASGLLAFLADGSQTKPLHAGWAAQAGVQAALLAGAGAEGPSSVLEDVNGLFASFVGAPVDTKTAFADLGSEWETPRIAFKAYPACHFVHASVDAAAAALAGSGGTASEIEEVEVRVSDTGVGLVLDPLAAKLAPRTPYDAKFSLPFCVASRLVHGDLAVESFAPKRLGEESVLALARRFRYSAWSVAEAPAPFAGEVSLRLRDGRKFVELVEHPLGSPENPMDGVAVADKFRANARTALGEPAAERLLAGLTALAERSELGGLLEILATAAPREVVSG